MQTMEELEAVMREEGLSGHFAALKPFVKNAIHLPLEPLDDGDIAVGASKFGGCPDLPAGTAWFRVEATGAPMSFLAQINFAETKPFDKDGKLPDHGILYLFFDCFEDSVPWGFDPKDSESWKVFFYDGDPDALARSTAPADLKGYGKLFGAARLGFENRMEVPDVESDLCRLVKLPRKEADQFWDWELERLEEERNKLLGHSDNVQGGMELECEYVTHGIYCGDTKGYRTGKAMGLHKNAAHWNLLLQIASNEDLDMMWGDEGMLYLWITDEDLAARNFEKAWLILQCG